MLVADFVPISLLSVVRSVTRWVDNFPTFGHLHPRILPPEWHTKFAKVGQKFCPIVNKPSKIAQDFEDFAKMAKFRQILTHYLPTCNNTLV